MTKTIIIDGKKYRLLPYQEEKQEIQSKEKVEEESLWEDHGVENKEVKKAVGKVSDYRERFKRRELSPVELVSKPKIVRQLKKDRSLDKFSYKGEKLFFGEGIQQEY